MSGIRPHITATIGDLRTFREDLDRVIRMLEVFNAEPATVPPAPAPRALPAGRKKKPEPTQAAGDDVEVAILAVLKRGGWMKPKDVIHQARISKSKALRARNRLIETKQIVVRGETAGARWALPGTPAKEEP